MAWTLARGYLGDVRSILVVVAVLALGAGACKPAVTDSADGKQVFAETCSTCHGPLGKPPAAMVARIGVRDLTSAELRGRVSVGLVENQVRRGSANKLMPSFEGVLSDAQITAVAEWVASPAFVAQR
jgi:mono/diheme cytochrome c family protein